MQPCFLYRHSLSTFQRVFSLKHDSRVLVLLLGILNVNHTYVFGLKMMLSGHIWRHSSHVSGRKSFLLFSQAVPLFPKIPFLTLTQEMSDVNKMGGAMRGVDLYSHMTFDAPKRPKRPQSCRTHFQFIFGFFRSWGDRRSSIVNTAIRRKEARIASLKRCKLMQQALKVKYLC